MSDIALKVTSDSSQARRDLDQLNKSVAKIEGTTTNTARSLVGLAAGVTAAFAAFSAARAITSAADQFTNLENKLALVVGRTKELVKVQEELLAVAIRSRGTIEGAAEVFNRFGVALKNSGASTGQFIKATESVQKAIALSGANAESARAAITQLGQGLASGQLRGEELNSVLEQTPRIAKAIADNLNVSVGELRKLAEQGQLTSDVVFGSLLDQAEKINEEFGLLTPTVAQATSRLRDSLGRVFNEIAKNTGISVLLAEGITSVAARIEDFAENADIYFTILQSRINLFITDVKNVFGSLGALFTSLGKQILYTIPILRTFTAPLTVIANSILFDNIRNSFNAFYDATVNSRLAVKGFVEQLGLFVIFGDTRVARTLAAIFDSKSLNEFNANVRKLADGLNPDNFDSFLSFAITLNDFLFRPFYQGLAAVKSFGASLGLISNPLIEITNIRFDRFVELWSQALQIFSLIIQTKVTPAIFNLASYVVEFSVAIIESTKSLLGIGPGFANVLVVSFNRANIALKLFTANLIGLDTAIGYIYGFTSAWIGVKGVVAEVILSVIGLFLLLVDNVQETAIRLALALKPVIAFAKGVKDAFYDVYDKVVGNSYWPDTVDGVIDYAKRLWAGSKEFVIQFKDNVLGAFKAIASSPIVFSLRYVMGAIGQLADFSILLVQANIFLSRTFFGLAFDALKTADSLKDVLQVFKDLVKVTQIQLKLTKNAFFDSDAYGELQFSLLVAKVSFMALGEEILDFTKNLAKSLNIVKSFANKVKDYFFDVYDKVVGNSYWPDLVEGVLDWANKLYQDGTKVVRKFANTVTKEFQKLSNLEINGLNLLSGIKDVIVTVKAKVSGIDPKELVQSIPVDQIISLAKNLVNIAIGTALFGLVAPTQLAFIGSAIAASLKSTLGIGIAEKVYEAIDLDLFKELGQSAGELIGYYVRTALLELPTIFGTIISFLEGFADTFLSQMGVVGAAIKNVASLLTLGQDGVLGLWLFGGGITLILSKLEVAKQALDVISGLFKSDKKEGGVLGQALLGPNFKYTVGAVGILLSAFSSQVSLVSAVVAATPLLATAILGEDVAGKIVRDTVAKVFQFVLAQSLALSQKVVSTDIFKKLFGEVKSSDLSATIGSAKSAISTITKNINDDASRKAYLSGEGTLSDLIFGKDDPNKLKAKAKEKVDSLITATKAAIDNTKSKFSGSKEIPASVTAAAFQANLNDVMSKMNQSSLDSVLKSALVGNPETLKTSVADVVTQATTVITDLKAKAKAENESGLLGGLLTGKKAAVAAAIAGLALFAGQAQAAEAQVNTVTKDIVSSITSFVGDYGIYALMLPPAGWAFFSGALKGILNTVRGLGVGISGALLVARVAFSGLFATLALVPGVLAKTFAGLKLLASGIGAAYALAASGFSVLIAKAAILQAQLTVILYQLLTIMRHPIFLLATAVVVGAGVIYTLLFGEGEGFFDKLDDVYKKILKLFSLKPSAQKELEKILPKTELGGESIDYTGKFSNLNYGKLTENQFQGIKKITQEYSDLIRRAREEEEDYGLAQAETLTEMAKVKKLLDSRLERNSIKGAIEDLTGSMDLATKRAKNMFNLWNKGQQGLNAGLEEGSNIGRATGNFIEKNFKFNDLKAKQMSSALSAVSDSFRDMQKDLKPEEIQGAVSALNNFSEAMANFEGVKGVLQKLGIGNWMKETEQLETAKERLESFNESLIKVVQKRRDVKAYQKSNIETTKILSQYQIEVSPKDILFFDDSDKLAVQFINDEIKDLQKQLQDTADNTELAVELQKQINIKTSDLKFTVEEAKLKQGIATRIEDLFKTADIKIDPKMFARVVNPKVFEDAQPTLVLYREQLRKVGEELANAGSLSEYNKKLKEQQELLDKVRGVIFNITPAAISLPERLSAVGISVSQNILDALGPRTQAVLDKTASRIEENQALILKYREAVANGEKDKKSADKIISKLAIQIEVDKKSGAKAAEFVIRNFSENFSDKIGKSGLSLDMSKALQLTPEESKKVGSLIADGISSKELIDKLARDVNGLPVDKAQAKQLAEKLIINQKAVDEIVRDIGVSLPDKLSAIFQRANISVNLFEAFEYGGQQLIKNFVSIANQIEKLDEEKKKIKDSGSMFDADLTRLLEIEEEQNKLRRRVASYNKSGKTLSTSTQDFGSAINVSLPDNFLSEISDDKLNVLDQFKASYDQLIRKRTDLSKRANDDSFVLLNSEAYQENEKAIAKLRDRFDIFVNGEIPSLLKKASIDFEFKDIFNLDIAGQDKLKSLLKEITTVRERILVLQKNSATLTEEEREEARKLTGQVESLKTAIDQLKAPQTFGDLFAKVENGFGLSKDQIMNLDLTKLTELAGITNTIDTLQKQIAATKLSEGKIDSTKLKALQDQLRIQEGISAEVARRNQIRDQTLSATNDAIKGILKNESGVMAKLKDSLSNMVIDGFSSQLNNFLFKGVATSLGDALGLDMFGMGELGSSMLNAMWVRMSPVGLNGMNGAAGGGNIFGSLLGSATNLFNTLTNDVGAVFGATSLSQLDYASLSGFADGGMVPGHGTGAVPIVAHAGEIILNEAQQARVAAAMNQPAQQMINVNITGDISRQTKSEIYKMLPSIAEGVNSHNREKGFRG